MKARSPNMKRCPYTRAAPSAGFYEQAVRNPAMPLGGSIETELLRFDLL
jgi:hypothetical protein